MKRLLLLGGGHAHVQVIRDFARSPPAGTVVTLISSQRLTPYSGMLPGLIAGHYSRAQSHIDLAALCAAAGVAFVEQEASSLDLPHRRVLTATGAEQDYDLLSVDTGSAPPLATVPGAQEHAIPIKPVDRFLRAMDQLTVGLDECDERAIAVVGAGAAGFEVILALDHRIHQHAGRSLARLHLVTESPVVLPEFTPRLRRYAERALRNRGIAVHVSARATEVDAKGIRLFDGRRIDAEHVIFVTGAAPAAIYARAGLRTDRRGFIAVTPGLQSLSHPEVFACGDVATVLAHPRPKAGVFAVRQGPPLIRNLRLALAGEEPIPFVPQRNYLVLLSTGRKHAIATRNGFTVQGRWIWRWKDWIDRRFVDGFAPARFEQA